MKSKFNQNQTKKTLRTKASNYEIYSIEKLIRQGFSRIEKLPLSIKILLESAIRNYDDYQITLDDIKNIAGWSPKAKKPKEIDRKSVV